MRPIAVEMHSRKGYVITHQCERCGVRRRNKAAADDSFEAILLIASRSDAL